MKKLKNLNQKEIEEVNEYFLNFFAEEEKIFLENFSRLEEGFLIKAIIDEFWENFEEDENENENLQKLKEDSSLDNPKEFVTPVKGKKNLFLKGNHYNNDGK